jgi:hypothetical protein
VIALPAVAAVAVLGPFANAAADLRRYGLAPIPLGGDEGKTPLIRGFMKWGAPPPIPKLDKWAAQFPGANIGIVTGPRSKVTVIDIDSADPALWRAMEDRFGHTPLKVRTPSGGLHLYYRHNGEGCRNLRGGEGPPVDVKGAGGLVVVPPSVRICGTHAGREYEFISGDWCELGRLPTLRPRSLSASKPGVMSLRATKEGHRNNSLFRHLLRQARHCDTIEALLDVAETINIDFDPPLSDAEVGKTAASAWQYQIAGRNWVGSKGHVNLDFLEFDALLRDDPHGVENAVLLIQLRRKHWNRQAFAAPPEALSKAKLVPGWGPKKYARSLRALVALGFLKIVHKGGRGPNAPHLYAFGP